MNEVIKAILERRTYRSFTDEAVSAEQVRTILDCALAAPSGMGKQTWKFTAVVNPEKIQRLAAAVGAAQSTPGHCVPLVGAGGPAAHDSLFV